MKYPIDLFFSFPNLCCTACMSFMFDLCYNNVNEKACLKAMI